MDGKSDTKRPRTTPAKKGKKRKTETPIASRSDPLSGPSQEVNAARIGSDGPSTANGALGNDETTLFAKVIARDRTHEDSVGSLFDVPLSPPPSKPLTTSNGRLQHKIKQLEAEVEHLKSHGEQEVRKARLDDIFHRDLAEKKYDALLEKVRQQGVRMEAECKRHLVVVNEMKRQITEKDAKVNTLEGQLETEKAKVTVAISEQSFWRDQADHTTHLLRTAEEDFEELSKFEVEERSRRENEAQRSTQLPPAYGSLDADDVRLEAKDSGALDLASLKRVVRNAFHGTLKLAQSPAPPGQPAGDDRMVLLLSKAVEFAVFGVQASLRHADETSIVGKGASTRKLRRAVAKTEYIAERLAKLVLDTIARAVTALESKPNFAPRLSDNDYTKTRLSWSTADMTLLETLRLLFRHAPPSDASADAKRKKLFLLQYFLTQVNMLKTKFNASPCMMVYGLTRNDRPASRLAGGRLLEQSLLWLEEQVESERMIAANDNTSPSEQAPDPMPGVVSVNPAGSRVVGTAATAEEGFRMLEDAHRRPEHALPNLQTLNNQLGDVVEQLEDPNMHQGRVLAQLNAIDHQLRGEQSDSVIGDRLVALRQRIQQLRTMTRTVANARAQPAASVPIQDSGSTTATPATPVPEPRSMSWRLETLDLLLHRCEVTTNPASLTSLSTLR